MLAKKRQVHRIFYTRVQKLHHSMVITGLEFIAKTQTIGPGVR